MSNTPVTDKVISDYLAYCARSRFWQRDREYVERKASKDRLEPWHVAWWTTNRGKREGFIIKCESDRHLVGTAYARFGKYEECKAQDICEAHNKEIGQ